MTLPRWAQAAFLGVVVVATAASAAGQQRAFGAHLDGGEILVELAKVAPGDGVPGIYAVGDHGEARLLIAFGSPPRWSPDRRRFAFKRGRELWVADIQEGRSWRVDAVAGLSPLAPVCASPVADPPLIWLPDSSRVGGWFEAESAIGRAVDPALPDFTTFRPFTCDAGREDAPAEGLLLGIGRVSVGRVTFATASGAVCFESFDWRPDVGPVGREVRVVAKRGDPPTPVRIEGLSEAVLCNPLWEPDGQRLALDCILPDGTRQIAIHDTGGGASCVLPSPEPRANWLRSIEWAPDGGRLLIASSPAGGWQRRTLWLADLTDGIPDARFVSLAGSLPQLYQACLSPDGARYAQLGGRGAVPPSAGGLLEVAEVRAPGQDVVFVRPPSGDLSVVRFDW